MEKTFYKSLSMREAQSLFCLMREASCLNNAAIAEALGRKTANVALWVNSRKPPLYVINFLESEIKAQSERFAGWRGCMQENAEAVATIVRVKDGSAYDRAKINADNASKLRWCVENGRGFKVESAESEV